MSPSTTAMSVSFDPAGLELVDHFEPKLGRFVLFDPKPDNVLLFVRIERQRHIDGLVRC